jgi:hypothetical protein
MIMALHVPRFPMRLANTEFRRCVGVLLILLGIFTLGMIGQGIVQAARVGSPLELVSDWFSMPSPSPDADSCPPPFRIYFT